MADNRNRTTLIALAVSATLLLAHRTQSQEKRVVQPEEVGVSSDKVNELSRFMQSLVDQGMIAGGVTLMARHGKVVHLKAVGMANQEAEKPMQTDAIFRIASMTKPITSAAIMMLCEQGKLTLDDPVSHYIPEFRNPTVLIADNPLKTEPAKREITIRHLLTHTSGLGYPDTDHLGRLYREQGIPCGCVTSSVTLEENMKKLGVLPLSFHPGEQWQYGMSTDVLGRVIEVISGMTLDRFFEDKIFQPLGMQDTFFKVPKDKQPRLTAAYLPEGDGIRKLNDGEIVNHDPDPISGDYPYSESHNYFSGGGDLCSTPSDYTRFCQMLLNGGEFDGVRLLREGTVKLMTTNHIGNKAGFELPGGFGLGFHVLPNSEDVDVQLRNAYAWFGFWSTSFRISPNGDWIVLTMAQVAWDDSSTPAWFAKYEQLAGDSIVE